MVIKLLSGRIVGLKVRLLKLGIRVYSTLRPANLLRWNWALESSGDFSVASVRKAIDDKLLPDVDSKTRWIKYVPIKVNVHAWKVKTDSLPMRFNISRRGIDIKSLTCAICDNGVETSSHLFFSCCMVRQISCMIARWWDVPYVEVDSHEEWISWLVNLRILF
ncbi:RNA-directed DNA polymerase, eukaryota [Tanacetum coccineum]